MQQQNLTGGNEGAQRARDGNKDREMPHFLQPEPGEIAPEVPPESQTCDMPNDSLNVSVHSPVMLGFAVACSQASRYKKRSLHSVQWGSGVTGSLVPAGFRVSGDSSCIC